MGHDGAHSHGPRAWDWRVLAVLAVAGVCSFPAGRSVLFGGLTAALIWLSAVFAVAASVLVALMIRAMRRKRPDYVRCIHGTTDRDRLLDENARIRRQVEQNRATREHRLAMHILQVADKTLIPGDYAQHATITGRIEGIPGHEALPEPR